MAETAENTAANAQMEQQAEQAPQPNTLWNAVKKVGFGGFARGAMITAAVLVAAFALVTGTMGSGAIGQLAVNGSIVKTFESGFAHGLGKAMSFAFTSVVGLSALAVGGAVNTFVEARKEQKHQELEDTKAVAQEFQRALEQEKEKARAPEIHNHQHNHPAPQIHNHIQQRTPQVHNHIHEPRVAAADPNMKWRAAELTRQAELKNSVQAKA